MNEEDQKNLAGFKEQYIKLVLDNGKEFAAMLMPVVLTKDDVKKFDENSPDIEDEFMSAYAELIKKYRIMFVPQIVQKTLDDESKKIYEGEIDTQPFATT